MFITAFVHYLLLNLLYAGWMPVGILLAARFALRRKSQLLEVVGIVYCLFVAASVLCAPSLALYWRSGDVRQLKVALALPVGVGAICIARGAALRGQRNRARPERSKGALDPSQAPSPADAAAPIVDAGAGEPH